MKVVENCWEKIKHHPGKNIRYKIASENQNVAKKASDTYGCYNIDKKIASTVEAQYA